MSDWGLDLAQNAGASMACSSLTLVGHFLTKLFSRLDEEGVSYCVLRGYEGLPEVVEHDVDLLLNQEDLELFEHVLGEVCLSTGWYLVRTVSRFSFHSWYVASEDKNALPSLLHIDVWTQIHWKAVIYADKGTILSTRRPHNSIWVASLGSEAAISLLKEYLQYGKVKDKGDGKTKHRITKLVEEDPDNFLATLEPCLGEPLSQFMLECARKADWPRLEGQVGKVRRHLITRALARCPIGQLWSWIRFLWGHFSDKVLRPSGLFVCLIGPDGSGKTTISEGLQREMKAIFNEVRYYHGHWGLLPELRVYYKFITSLLGKRKGAFRSNKVSSGQAAAPFSLVRALLYVLYYSFEYILGHFLLLRAKARGELILFDRYFYDYIIQSSYSCVPRCLLRLIERVLPRPDVLIWLHNHPELIHERKPELSVSEIQEQAEVCKSIVERYPNNAYIVWTDDDPEITLALVKKKILDFMAQQAVLRGVRQNK
jgi:thymidylate kinase